MNKTIFIIGGQRSGSSFLRDILNQHSQIKFSEPFNPETKYFIRNVDANFHDFKDAFFKDIPDNIILAEKSTSYFEYNYALTKISEISQKNKGKVIYIYRDPVYRAISNFKFSVLSGVETRTIKDVFCKKIPTPKLDKNISVNPFDYYSRSSLTDIVPKLKELFKENLILVNFENLVLKTNLVVESILKTVNLSMEPINQIVSKNKSFELEVDLNVIEKIKHDLSEEIKFYEELVKTTPII